MFFSHMFLFTLLGNILAADVEEYSLLMPNVTPHKDELYLCTPIKVDRGKNYFIVGFEPNATMHTAHHMLLYGCTKPGSNKPVWNCGEMQNEVYDDYDTFASPCSSGSQIIYAWARDAPRLDLPEGVGFRVGGSSPIQYLVLQVHYMHKFHSSDATDNSGIFFRYTTEPLNKLAGVILLGTAGVIPPMQVEHMETSCQITEDKIIHPFAYRTHTHSLGKVVSGYVVRANANGEDEWTLLGKRNPLTPQMFYPVENTDVVTIGDTLAARCTMESTRRSWTKIGSTNKDEMCNFYLMYWVENGEPLQRKYCFSPGPPHYSWHESDPTLRHIPEQEASTI